MNAKFIYQKNLFTSSGSFVKRNKILTLYIRILTLFNLLNLCKIFFTLLFQTSTGDWRLETNLKGKFPNVRRHRKVRFKENEFICSIS